MATAKHIDYYKVLEYFLSRRNAKEHPIMCTRIDINRWQIDFGGKFFTKNGEFLGEYDYKLCAEFEDGEYNVTCTASYKDLYENCDNIIVVGKELTCTMMEGIRVEYNEGALRQMSIGRTTQIIPPYYVK